MVTVPKALPRSTHKAHVRLPLPMYGGLEGPDEKKYICSDELEFVWTN